MTEYMILSAGQATTAREANDRLDPVGLTDGSYALNLSVLDAPDLAAALAPLGDLPRREVGPDEWSWKLGIEWNA